MNIKYIPITISKHVPYSITMKYTKCGGFIEQHSNIYSWLFPPVWVVKVPVVLHCYFAWFRYLAVFFRRTPRKKRKYTSPAWPWTCRGEGSRIMEGKFTAIEFSFIPGNGFAIAGKALLSYCPDLFFSLVSSFLPGGLSRCQKKNRLKKKQNSTFLHQSQAEHRV